MLRIVDSDDEPLTDYDLESNSVVSSIHQDAILSDNVEQGLSNYIHTEDNDPNMEPSSMQIEEPVAIVESIQVEIDAQTVPVDNDAVNCIDEDTFDENISKELDDILTTLISRTGVMTVKEIEEVGASIAALAISDDDLTTAEIFTVNLLLINR